METPKGRFNELESFIDEYDKLDRKTKREFAKWAANELGLLRETVTETK